MEAEMPEKEHARAYDLSHVDIVERVLQYFEHENMYIVESTK